jgi:hypothetical protein
VLAAHEALAEACARPGARPLLVDVGVPFGTAHRVLEAARETRPDLEFVARFHSGLTGAAAGILDGRLDVSFGRAAGLDPALLARLESVPVRLEPMAVLLPAGHPLAGRTEVPVDALAGETLYAAAGNRATAEWTDLAERLFAGRGIEAAAPFPEIEGEAEFARAVRRKGWSVLASTEFADVPGMVLRPLTDPVPLSPVSLVWRAGLRHPGVDALREAARALGAAGRWLERPGGSWLPAADEELLAAG